MTQDTNRPNETTETTDEQRRCRCGRELRRGATGAEAAVCIGCEHPEAECACGPKD